MSFQGKYISWVLVLLLTLVIVYQYRGANRAEQRAAQAESVARETDAKLKDFMVQSARREAAAQARYEASMAEGAQLRAILAKGSQAKPQNAPQSSQEPIRQALEAAKGSVGQEPAQAPQNACQPFIYQGSNLTIEGFQVSVCDQQPVVQAEAAVAYHDEKALTSKLNVQLSEAIAKLTLEEQSLDAYKKAEQQWKKAAKKSRVKRVLSVAAKVGLFAAGVYVGRKF